MHRALSVLALGLAAVVSSGGVSSAATPTTGGAADVTTTDVATTDEARSGVQAVRPSATGTEVEVWDVEQIDEIVYVAGSFIDVVAGGDAATTMRSGVVAFTADGQFLDWFEPDIRGGHVYGLAASPDGKRLFIAGEFRSVEGQGDTAGLAALDPATGRLDANWRAGLERPWSDDGAVGRDLEVHGDHLYVAGNFSHIRSANALVQLTRVGRVELNSGLPDRAFHPMVNGEVLDLDIGPGGDRVYLVGLFTSVNGSTEFGDRFATVRSSDGALIGNVQPYEFATASIGDLYTVLAVGDLVFVGGEKHTLQVLDAETLTRRHLYFTGSPSFVSTRLLDGGGAYQSLELVGNRVFAGCDCSSYHLAVADDADFRTELALTGGRWTPVRGVAVYDATTGEHLPDETLEAETPFGVWAVHGDNGDCIWIRAGAAQAASSSATDFAQRCDPATAADTTRPSPPRGLILDGATDEGVAIRWTVSTDDIGVTGYQIHRTTESDGIGPVIGTSTGPSFVDTNALAGVGYHYVVKAVDSAGNSSWRSNTLDVVVGSADDLERPTPPRGLQVTNTGNGRIALFWTGSDDNGGDVTGYQVHRSTNGELGPVIATTGGTSFVDESVNADTEYTYATRAIDGAENISWRSNFVTASLDERPGDGQRPSPPTGLRTEVDQGFVQLFWNDATDDTGVATYRLHRSTDGSLGDVIDTGFSGLSDTSAVPGEAYTYAVTAIDEAGNISWRSNLATTIAP